LILHWRADGVPTRDLKVFVHLVDGAGALAGQHDARPAGERRPTGTWLGGEIVLDEHPLVIPPGSAPLDLAIGLYDPLTGERMPIVRGPGAGAEDRAVRVALPARGEP
jgi:hypothetical protein